MTGKRILLISTRVLSSFQRQGSHVTTYAAIDSLVVGERGIAVTVRNVRPNIDQLLAPLPYDGLSIYCVGEASDSARAAPIFVPSS